VYAGGAEIMIPRWQHWARAARKRLDQLIAADAQKLGTRPHTKTSESILLE